MVLRKIAARVASGERGAGGTVRLFAKRRQFDEFVGETHAELYAVGAAVGPVSQAAAKGGSLRGGIRAGAVHQGAELVASGGESSSEDEIVDKPPTKRVSVAVRLYISFGYGWV